MTASPGRDFEEFVRGSTPRLARQAYALTWDVHLAEDLVQETHIRVAQYWRKLGRQRDDPFPYARTTLYRLWIDGSRWRSRRPEVVGDVPEVAVEDESGIHADRDEVRRMLLCLAPRARAVIALRYLEDLNDREISAILDVPRTTVQSQLRIAITQLRRLASAAEANSGGKP